jgi:diphthamide biosynthesis protein 4
MIKLDYYQLLSISKNASTAQIKSAYHRALLHSHPDKKKSSEPIDIALIKEAYSTLSNPQLRAKYDAQYSHSAAPPRPAQVVSLENFEEVEVESERDAEDSWRYTCRCGGSYHISITLMEKGEHLIACNSCSEVIWVGYELVES